MNKLQTTMLVAFSLTIVACRTDNAYQKATDQNQSLTLRNEARLDRSLPRDDYRLEISDLKTLQRRIADQVCVLDKIGFNQGRSEVYIGVGQSIQEVLKSAGFPTWERPRPQLRLLKRNSILQSPTRSIIETNLPPMSEFLSVRVSPGDYLIICLTE